MLKIRLKQQKVTGFSEYNFMTYVDHELNYPPGKFYFYHLDEAFEHNLNVDDVKKLAKKIGQENSSAVLYLSSYKFSGRFRNSYEELIKSTDNTRIICDQYYDGTIFCGSDQRNFWSDFKDFYKDAADAFWIHLLVDGLQDSFDNLFKHADKLGVNKLWVYAGDASNSWFLCDNKILTKQDYDFYLSVFAEAAWKNNWLIKTERKYIYEFIHSTEKEAEASGNHWILINKKATDELRELPAN
jgi:hypothetical protein